MAKEKTFSKSGTVADYTQRLETDRLLQKENSLTPWRSNKITNKKLFQFLLLSFLTGTPIHALFFFFTDADRKGTYFNQPVTF